MEKKNKGKFKYNLIKTGAVIALTATIFTSLTGCGVRLKSVTPSYDQQSSSNAIVETYTENSQRPTGTVGQSNNSYFYNEHASLNQTISTSDYYFYPSKNNDNADRRLTQSEYVNMIMSITGADYNEFVSLVDNTDVVYTYADYYQVDRALEEQARYADERAAQPSQFTDPICNIREIPSEALIKQVILNNSSEYLKSHPGLTPMAESEIDIIVGLIHHMVEINYDKFNDTELRRIYSILNDISVVGIDSYNFDINDLRKPYNARVLENGTVMIDLETLNKYLTAPNAKERTYEHEIYHLFQRMCPNAQIDTYYQIGPSQYFDDLQVNSLHWNWLYEASAEKLSMDHFEAANPLVYKNMIGYLKSLDLITLIRPDYEQTAVEDSTLIVDEDYIFELLGAKTDEEKREVINLLYSIDYLQNNRDDFEAVYQADHGASTKTIPENTRMEIKRDMKNSVCLSLTKIFYRNLAERVKNTEVSIQDIFYLINAFEEDISWHTYYDEESQNYEYFMGEYVRIQDGFFKMLAGGNQDLYNDIVESFNSYSMAIQTDEGLRRNCQLDWLTEGEKKFIYDQMVSYNMSYMTTNIRNTK
ncbi:MAG: hypothetical protein II625_04705 [Bacilli bacterium]|nr:hypothetical protein [Bacilli bacterium]